jgi:predicted ATP-grasp superfamily ATP-dependent carboligase
LNETTWEPELLERAATLWKALDWHGPAQVELKVDEKSGRASLLEVNGRFWGTLDLSVRAGVNFPWLAARIAKGLPVRAPEGYRVGLRYRWPIPYGLLLALHRESRWQAVRMSFLPRKGMLSDLMLSDPAPHQWEAAFYVYRMVRRRSLRPVRDLGPGAAAETARQTGGQKW